MKEDFETSLKTAMYDILFTAISRLISWRSQSIIPRSNLPTLTWHTTDIPVIFVNLILGVTPDWYET